MNNQDDMQSFLNSLPEGNDMGLISFNAHLDLQFAYLRFDIFKQLLQLKQNTDSVELDVPRFLAECEEVYGWVIEG